jgi:phospholipid/cholesterol/gamma-HCH transport system substrate-binding protein
MKRVGLIALIVAAAGAFLVFASGSSNQNSVVGTYKIEFDNAFGLVPGADFKVAGVKAGKIQGLDLDPKTLHAVVTVQVTQQGFGQFRTDAFCESRPQSLIGEYFVECQPGERGKVLKPGSTIPVNQTQSTIPGDLLQDVLRLPYRQRFTLIINELGAAVAARSEDLGLALRRAVPALAETDNLLNVLANDSSTIQQLTANSDTVVTALANNTTAITRFIDEAGRTAQISATQQAGLRGTFQQLPGFLEQLRPAMAQLGQATDANTPALQNLHTAAGELNRLFTDLPGFSRSALPAIRSLGQASVTGRSAVNAAGPTIRDLNSFARTTPELAQNLNIVLKDLDNRGRAVEADSRSPGGQGYTGIEAVLQYVFNQAVAINTYGSFSHLLAVDLFADPQCTPYATPATIALSLQRYGATYRHCYAWLGPNQPGVNVPDPSNPRACVPDPGGAPPGKPGPAVTACKLSAADVKAAADSAKAVQMAKAATTTRASGTPVSTTVGGSGASSTAPSGNGSLGTLLSNLIGGLGTGGSSSSSGAGAASGSTGSQTSSGGGQGGSSQTKQLLNYLLAP